MDIDQRRSHVAAVSAHWRDTTDPTGRSVREFTIAREGIERPVTGALWSPLRMQLSALVQFGHGASGDRSTFVDDMVGDWQAALAAAGEQVSFDATACPANVSNHTMISGHDFHTPPVDPLGFSPSQGSHAAKSVPNVRFRLLH